MKMYSARDRELREPLKWLVTGKGLSGNARAINVSPICESSHVIILVLIQAHIVSLGVLFWRTFVTVTSFACFVT